MSPWHQWPPPSLYQLKPLPFIKDLQQPIPVLGPSHVMTHESTQER